MIYNSVVPYGFGEIRSSVEGALLGACDYVVECENLLYEMTGRHAVLVESGLAAILLYLELKEISSGDEILLPGYLCQWVCRGLLEKGYKIKFIDVMMNYNLSPYDLSLKLTGKTKAVIAVHSYGLPCDINKIKEIISGNRILLIEDSAQSFGYENADGALGFSGDCGIYSFGWFKPVTAMGGGALICRDLDLIKKARAIVSRKYSLKEKIVKMAKAIFYLNKTLYHQIVLGAYGLKKNSDNAKNEIEERCGLHSCAYRRIQNLQASIAICQFKQAKYFNKKRIENAKLILNDLSVEGVKIPEDASTYPLLRLPLYFENYTTEKVLLLSQKLYESGIDAPLLYPYLPELLRIRSQKCLTAKKLSEKTLHLPVHPSLRKSDIEYIKVQLEHICGTL